MDKACFNREYKIIETCIGSITTVKTSMACCNVEKGDGNILRKMQINCHTGGCCARYHYSQLLDSKLAKSNTLGLIPVCIYSKYTIP
jgi:hypothetical protein